MQVLRPKIIDWILKILSLTNISGMLYPPKNNIAEIQLNNTIELYSPKKKKTNGTALCSVMNPETNSDSKVTIYFTHIWYVSLNNLPDFKYRKTIALVEPINSDNWTII